jgi:hypothetical protein
MTDWTVLLADPLGVDLSVLGRFYASEKKIPLIDAQRLARRSWGFLGRDLSAVEAQALVRSAAVSGVKALVVENTHIPSLPTLYAVRGARFEGDHVDLHIGVPATLRPIAFSNIQLLSVSTFRQDNNVVRTTKEEASTGRKIAGLGIMLTTGIPVGMGKSKETARTVSETEWVLTLDILGDGGRWRVVPAAFDFSGLGVEKGTTGPENLRRLLTRLHREAPSALLNRGARWWLEGRPLNTAGYDDASDVDQESRWLLTLSRGS